METCNCIYCQLILCAKFQNPRTTPSVRKVCDTKHLGVLAPQSVHACPSTQWEDKSNKKIYLKFFAKFQNPWKP